MRVTQDRSGRFYLDEITKSLLEKAVQGDPVALNYFLKVEKIKVYTKEEIQVLNKFFIHGNEGKVKVKEEKEIMNLPNEKYILYLPNLQGEFLPAQLDWIQELESPYFRAGLTYLSAYSYGGTSTEWVLKSDPTEGFRPMFCALYWAPSGGKNEGKNEGKNATKRSI